MLGNRKYGNSNTVESRLRPPKSALDVKAKCATTKDAKVRDARPHVDKNSIKVGDRVAILGSKFGSRGNVRYLGKVEFAEGVWCGVELDCNEGKNDGMVGSKRYFSCRPNYGLFALLEKVRLLSADEDVCSQKAESAIVPSKKTVVSNTDKIRLVVGLTVEKSSSPRPAQSENITGKKKLPTRQKDLAMRRQSDIFPINKKANDKVVSKIDIVVEKPNKQAALSQQNRRRTLDGDALKMKLPSYKNTPRRQSTGCATTAQKLAAPAYYAIPEVDTKNDILSAMLDSNSVGSSENNNGKSSEANTLDSTFTINISPLPEPRVDAKTALRIAYDVEGSSTQRESDVGLNPDCKGAANQFTNQIKNARLGGDIGFTPGTFIASLDASSFGLLDEIYLEDNSLLQQNRNSGAVGKNKIGKKITAKKKITPPSAHSSKGTTRDSHVQPANPVDGSILLTDRDFGKEITCTSTPVRLKSVSDEKRSIGKTPKRSSASEKMLMQSATPKSNLPKRISGKKIATEKVCLASGDGFGNKEFKSSANSMPIHGRARDKVEDCVIKKKTSTKASTIRISPNSSNDKDEFVHEVDYEVFDNEDLNQRTSRDAGIQEFFDDQDGLMSRLDLDREGGANFCPGDFQNLVTSFSLDSLSRNPHLISFPANKKLVVSQKSCSSPNVMGDQLLDNLAYLDSKVSEAIKESSRICSNLVKFHHQDLFNASSQFLADQIQNLSARGQQLRSFLSEITGQFFCV